MTLPWLGGLLGATYASFYARFSSQWSYLAGLYNQIMSVEVTLRDPTSEQLASLAHWKAAFIEDAEDLHLATKSLFAPAVDAWAADEAVRSAFEDGSVGGNARFEALMSAVRRTLTRHGLEPSVADAEPPSTVAAMSTSANA